MNYCPECGAKVRMVSETYDVGTYHRSYRCTGEKCGNLWEVSYQEGVEDKLLHIALVEEGNSE